MIIVEQLPLGKLDNWITIIIDNTNNQALVVDPAWDAEAILLVLKKYNAQLTAILLTHTHHDHISALKPLLAKQNITVPVYVSEVEYHLGRLHDIDVQLVKAGDNIHWSHYLIDVIATPGHTVGSVCYQLAHYLITGDTLFIDGCGRCDFPESDVCLMFDSLSKIKALSDDLIILPGHDYGQKAQDTLKNQKQTNPYLLINDADFFVLFRNQLQKQYRKIPFEPSSANEMSAIQQKHLPSKV